MFWALKFFYLKKNILVKKLQKKKKYTSGSKNITVRGMGTSVTAKLIRYLSNNILMQV